MNKKEEPPKKSNTIKKAKAAIEAMRKKGLEENWGKRVCECD